MPSWCAHTRASTTPPKGNVAAMWVGGTAAADWLCTVLCGELSGGVCSSGLRARRHRCFWSLPLAQQPQQPSTPCDALRHPPPPGARAKRQRTGKAGAGAEAADEPAAWGDLGLVQAAAAGGFGAGGGAHDDADMQLMDEMEHMEDEQQQQLGEEVDVEVERWEEAFAARLLREGEGVARAQ